jgi:hypothetical protein
MTDFTDHDEELIANFLDRSTAVPAPDLSELPANLRDEASARLAMLRSIAGVDLTPPPGAFERIAHRFGFDRPDSVDIDGRRVMNRRQHAGLQLSDFVNQIRQAGASVTTQECLRWKSSPSVTVDRHTATAISAILNLPVAEFEAYSTEVNEAQRFLASPEFDEMIARWCAEHERDHDATKREVTRQLAAAGYRAGGVTVEHLTEIVQQILEGLV